MNSYEKPNIMQIVQSSIYRYGKYCYLINGHNKLSIAIRDDSAISDIMNLKSKPLYLIFNNNNITYDFDHTKIHTVLHGKNRFILNPENTEVPLIKIIKHDASLRGETILWTNPDETGFLLIGCLTRFQSLTYQRPRILSEMNVNSLQL